MEISSAEAKIMLNQCLILTGLAYLVPKPLSDYMFKEADETRELVEASVKKLKDQS